MVADVISSFLEWKIIPGAVGYRKKCVLSFIRQA